MKKNEYSFSNFRMNDFVLYFSTEKKMKGNERKKIFFVKVIFFMNVMECIVPCDSFVTIHVKTFH